MAGDQVSQLETGTEPTPGPAETQVKSQSHHFWAETEQDSQTRSLLQPGRALARAAQTLFLKLPGGRELLVGHVVHCPYGNGDSPCLKHARQLRSSLAFNISSKANPTTSLGSLRAA